MTATVVSPRTLITTAVVATVACVYPGFLFGAVAVQVREEFSVSAGRYGWGTAAYFLAASASSVLTGRVVQRVGPRRQLVACLIATIVLQLMIAGLSTSFTVIVALLAACGVVNAANQTAVNLVLARARLPRLGLALAIKQSGMPSASMVSGIAVPLLAVTFGWRWSLALGVSLAVIGLVLVVRFVDGTGSGELRSARPRSSMRALLSALVVGSFLAFAAGGLTSWTVSSGVDAGLSESVAGWMLSLGAGCGIAMRLLIGLRLDRMSARPYAAVAAVTSIGAVAMVGLSYRSAPSHMVATVLAFGAGWVWPVFSNFGIMRANGDASGTASGITQMGIYLGVFAAPIVTGAVIDAHGYGPMWLLVAAVALVGSLLAYAIRDEF
jgi:MFS family permease